MSTFIDDVLRSIESDDDDASADSTGVDLEALLRGDDDDDDDDEPAPSSGGKSLFSSTISALRNPTESPLPPPSSNAPLSAASLLFPAASNSTAPPSIGNTRGPSEFDGQSGAVLPSNQHSEIQSIEQLLEGSPDPFEPVSTSQTKDGVKEDPYANDLLALKQTEQRELRLLQPVEKLSLSALQIRRANATGTVANLTHFEEVGEITKQLLRNGSFGAHGPGTATALCVCNKFLAIGTTKGTIILFDHKQEIRRVLSLSTSSGGGAGAGGTAGNTGAVSLLTSALNFSASAAASASSAAVEAAGATGLSMLGAGSGTSSAVAGSAGLKSFHVTALDCLSDGSCLLSGHRSGDLFLWDPVKGSVIKQLRDPTHSVCEVLGVSFLPTVTLGADPKVNGTLAESDNLHFLVWTSNHVIVRHKVARSLLSGWHAEQDCLLDDRSGAVWSLSVLRPCPSEDAGSSSPDAPDAGFSGGLSQMGQLDQLGPGLERDLHLLRLTDQFLLQQRAVSGGVRKEFVDLKRLAQPFQFFAFGFAHQTCIVQVQPVVKIVHKWKTSTPAASASTPASTSVEAVRELLDWAWLPLPLAPPGEEASSSDPSSPFPSLEEEASQQRQRRTRLLPVLTRCRGRYIELLAVRAYRTPAAPTTPAASASTVPSAQPNTSSSASSNSSAPQSGTFTALRRSSMQLLGGFMSSAATAAVPPAPPAAAAASAAPAQAEDEVQTVLEFSLLASCLVTLCEEDVAELLSSQNSQTSSGTQSLGILEVRWLAGSHQLLALTKREVLLLDLQLCVLERIQLARALAEPLQMPSSTQSLCFRTAAYAQQVYVLQAQHLQRFAVRSALDQVQSLVASGRWLEGLARLVEAVAKSPPLLHTEQDAIRRLLLNYAVLAVKRTSAHGASSSARTPLPASSAATSDHFHLVAAVCVEYCTATQNFPLLLNEVLGVFRSEQQQAALFDALEPVILRGQLTSLPARVLQELLESLVAQDKKPQMARCLCYLDPLQLDLNFVTRFLLTQRLYAAFVHVYGYGLGDLSAALQYVVADLLRRHLSSAPPRSEEVDSDWELRRALQRQPADPDSGTGWEGVLRTQADSLYLLWLCLLQVFRGQRFPRGTAQSYGIQQIWALLSWVTAERWTALPALDSSGPRLAPESLPPFVFLGLSLRLDLQMTLAVLDQGICALEAIVAHVQQQTQTQTQTVPEPQTPTVAQTPRFAQSLGREEVTEDDSGGEDEDCDGGASSSSSAPSADRKVMAVLGALHRCCALLDAQTDADSGEEEEEEEEEAQTPASTGDSDDEDAHSSPVTPRSAQSLGRLSSAFFERFLPRLCGGLGAALCPLAELAPALVLYCVSRGMNEHALWERRLGVWVSGQRRCLRRDPGSGEAGHLGRLEALLTRRGFHYAALHCTSSLHLLAAPPSAEAVQRALQSYLQLAEMCPDDPESQTLVFRYLHRLGKLLRLSQTLGDDNPSGALSAATQKAGEVWVSVFLRFLTPMYTLDATQTARFWVRHLGLCLDRLFADSGLPQAAQSGKTPGTRTALGSEESALRLGFWVSVLREFKLAQTPDAQTLRSGHRRRPSQHAQKSRSRFDPDFPESGYLEEGAVSSGHILAQGRVSAQSFQRLLRLLALHSADQVCAYLSEFSGHYDLDQSLEILRGAGVYDGVALLTERSGDAAGALQVLLSDVSRRVQLCRREVDSLLRAEQQSALFNSTTPGNNSNNNKRLTALLLFSNTSAHASSALSPRSPHTSSHTSAHASSHSTSAVAEVLVARVAACRRLQQIWESVLSLCERHSTSQNPQTSQTQTQALWFQALDLVLAERQSLRQGVVSAASEAVVTLLTSALHLLLSRLLALNLVSVSALLPRLTQTAGLKLGEFRELMYSMYGSQRDTRQWLEEVLRLVDVDRRALSLRKLQAYKRGHRFDQDGTPASKSLSSSQTPPRPTSSTQLLLRLLADSPAPDAAPSLQPSRRRITRGKIHKLRDIRNLTLRAQDAQHQSMPSLAPPPSTSMYSPSYAASSGMSRALQSLGGAAEIDDDDRYATVGGRRPGRCDSSQTRRAALDPSLVFAAVE